MGLRSTRKSHKKMRGGDHPPLSDDDLNAAAAALTSGDELVLTDEMLDQYLSMIPVLIEILEKNSVDKMAEEFITNKEYKGVLNDLVSPALVDKIEKDAVFFANSTYKSQTLKSRSKVSNLFNSKSGNLKGTVTNAAVKQRTEIYKQEVKNKLEELLTKAKAPSRTSLIEELKGFLEVIKSKKAAQVGGAAYQATTLDSAIDEYVRKHSKLDVKWRRVASRVFGIIILVGRGGTYAALVANGAAIGLLLQASAAMVYSTVIAILKIAAAVLAGLVALLFGSAGSGSGFTGSTSVGTAPQSSLSLGLSGLSQAGWNYMAIKGLSDMLGSGSKPTKEQIEHFESEYIKYNFVTSRVRKGMRIYNPFMKAHLPFTVLPKPSVIKYALSFIFTESPTLEPYGDEVNVIWRDTDFDNKIRDIYNKGDNLSLDNHGFKGNLFIGDGIFIEGKKINMSKYVVPYKTIIDEKGLPWTYDDKSAKFILSIKTESVNIETRKAVMNASKRGLLSRSQTTLSEVSSRSFKHPAYDFSTFTAFRNAVYLAARYKLKAYGKPVEEPTGGPVATVNPMAAAASALSVAKVVTNAKPTPSTFEMAKAAAKAAASDLPKGWVYITNDGDHSYYKCVADTDIPSVWDKPKDSCALPKGWKELISDYGEKYYECENANVESVWDKPTAACV